MTEVRAILTAVPMTHKETLKGFIFMDIPDKFLPELLLYRPLQLEAGKYATNTRNGLSILKDYRRFRLDEQDIAAGRKPYKHRFTTFKK